MFTVSYTDVVCLGHIHSTPPGYPILIILIAYVENHFYSWYSTAFRVEIWIVFILSGQYAGTTFVCGTLRTAWRFPLFTTGLPGLELRLSGLTASPHPPSQSHSTSSDPYAIYHSVGLFLFFIFFLSFSSVVVIRSQGPFPKAVEAWAVFSSNSFPHLPSSACLRSVMTNRREQGLTLCVSSLPFLSELQGAFVTEQRPVGLVCSATTRVWYRCWRAVQLPWQVFFFSFDT